MIRALLARARNWLAGHPHRAPTVDIEIDTDVDTVIDLLSNSRRREVIHRLADLAANEHDAQPTMDISDLAEFIAGLENDEPPGEQTTWNQRQRSYVALYQTHLPALASRGVIEYDRRAGVVAPTSDTVALAQLLSMIESACRGHDRDRGADEDADVAAGDDE